MPVTGAIGDRDEQVAEVAEALEAPLRLGGITCQALELGGSTAIGEKVVGVEPIEQRGGVSNVVDQHAALVANGVGEAHEKVDRLGRFGQEIDGGRHVCNHCTALDKLPQVR